MLPHVTVPQLVAGQMGRCDHIESGGQAELLIYFGRADEGLFEPVIEARAHEVERRPTPDGSSRLAANAVPIALMNFLSYYVFLLSRDG